MGKQMKYHFNLHFSRAYFQLANNHLLSGHLTNMHAGYVTPTGTTLSYIPLPTFQFLWLFL
jgi:hypothetical protein